MIQKYKITLTLTADDYMGLIPHLGSVSPKIEKVVDRTGPEEIDPSALRGAPRPGRHDGVSGAPRLRSRPITQPAVCRNRLSRPACRSCRRAGRFSAMWTAATS